MRPIRWTILATTLCLAACGSPRGGGGGLNLDPDGGGGGDASSMGGDGATPDGPGSSDATANDIAAPPDVTTQPDAPAPPDVTTQPDVTAQPDVTTQPDAPPAPRCGDGLCNGAETCESCRADCAATCPPPPDVPPAARCGDGTCNGTETCESCRADCASMCPPPPDVPPTARCGDSVCNGTETCSTCMTDCGPCGSGTLTTPCAPGVDQGPTRDCGWRPGTTFSCTPGRATMVGCSGTMGMGSLCQPTYGACTGDPVMRVCAGTQPCTAAMALAPASGSYDDQCGTCPSAYVACPSSGMIHVMTGDFNSSMAQYRGTCTPAVR